MSRRAQENIVASLLLIFFIGMIVISFGYSSRARMVPIPVATVSAVILVVQIYLMNFRKDINLNVDPTELLTGGQSKEEIEEVAGKVKTQKVKSVTEAFAILTLLVYIGMTMLFGIMAGVFLFVFGFFAFLTKMHWIKSLAVSLINAVIIYLFFGYLLEIQLYEGWLVKLIFG